MYYLKKLFDEKVDFDFISPDVQTRLRSDNFNFGLAEVANFIRINSYEFQNEIPELLAIDAAIEEIYKSYLRDEGLEEEKIEEKPIPEPAPVEAPEPAVEITPEVKAPDELEAEVTPEGIQQEIDSLKEIVEGNPFGLRDDDIEYYSIQIEILTDYLSTL